MVELEGWRVIGEEFGVGLLSDELKRWRVK